MTNKKAVAEKLLQINAIKLNVQEPFTWASGWKSPIYCDNRKALSFPFIRDFIKSEMSNVIFETYPDAEIIAGVATAGIAWGALAADQLKMPYIYVRPKPKEHGLGNQIEGFYEKEKKVVVVEDLISTGKSSLEICTVLQQAEMKVLSVISIFNYGFNKAIDSFEEAKIPFYSLTDYETLIQLAIEKKIVSPELENVLLNWRKDPANWKGIE